MRNSFCVWRIFFFCCWCVCEIFFCVWVIIYSWCSWCIYCIYIYIYIYGVSVSGESVECIYIYFFFFFFFFYFLFFIFCWGVYSFTWVCVWNIFSWDYNSFLLLMHHEIFFCLWVIISMYMFMVVYIVYGIVFRVPIWRPEFCVPKWPPERVPNELFIKVCF